MGPCYRPPIVADGTQVLSAPCRLDPREIKPVDRPSTTGFQSDEGTLGGRRYRDHGAVGILVRPRPWDRGRRGSHQVE
jgi:hypothetical protein